MGFCAAPPHSWGGFSSSAHLRMREHCALLRTAAPCRKDGRGFAPAPPSREPSSVLNRRTLPPVGCSFRIAPSARCFGRWPRSPSASCTPRFRLCVPFPHSCIGFSSSARLRARERCALLQAAAPHKENGGALPRTPAGTFTGAQSSHSPSGRLLVSHRIFGSLFRPLAALPLGVLYLPLLVLTFAPRSPSASCTSHFWF